MGDIVSECQQVVKLKIWLYNGDLMIRLSYRGVLSPSLFRQIYLLVLRI